MLQISVPDSSKQRVAPPCTGVDIANGSGVSWSTESHRDIACFQVVDFCLVGAKDSIR